MYPDHLQNWLDFAHGLLISSFWRHFDLVKRVIFCFWVFPGERMEGIAWNFGCWCILTTFRTVLILVMVCWFSSSWRHFHLVKRVQFGVSGYFPENAWGEYPQISHADVSWPPSELIRFWSCSLDFPHYGTPLTQWNMGHIWGFKALSGESLGVNVEGVAEAYLRRLASSSV